MNTIYKCDQTKSKIETIMNDIFFICASISIIAVLSITLYMFISGTPAINKIGFIDLLFNDLWNPTGDIPSYGILSMVMTSIVGVGLSLLLGVPIGVLTAVYMSEIASEKQSKILKSAIELLAGIPSVIYGLLGVLLINPMIYKLELWFYKDSLTHQFTGGSNLLSAILVLTIMILPTLINMSENALRSVPNHYRTSSLALGSSQIQTIFKVVLPCASKGIISAIVLGVGRAIGEAMAILLVAGNSVNVPFLFNSVRFLTTGIVSEMGYASGLHREVLFTIGLVLYVFILLINIFLTCVLKRGDDDE